MSVQLCGLAAPWNGSIQHVWMWCAEDADHDGDHRVRHEGKVYRWPVQTTGKRGSQ